MMLTFSDGRRRAVDHIRYVEMTQHLAEVKVEGLMAIAWASPQFTASN